MRWLILALAPLLLAGSPQAVPMAPGPQPHISVPKALFGNSIVCRNQVTHATCQLWLETDGRYVVAFNRGPQLQVPSIDGPWQIEGRTGRYWMRAFGEESQLCLEPDSGSGSYESERASEPFAGAGCYPLTAHATGDRWTQKDALGREIIMWLVEGR